MMTPYVVTRYYRAPEVIVGMKYKENGRPPFVSNLFPIHHPHPFQTCQAKLLLN